MRDLLEQDEPSPSSVRRVLLVVALLAVAAFVGVRFVDASDEPPEPAADRPTTQASAPPEPQPEPAFPFARDEPGRPIRSAPAEIRELELVAVSPLVLFHGPLDNTTGATTVTGDVPYATEEIAVLPFGTGVVIGPEPGASVPGEVRSVATSAALPTEPVAGIVPAYDGTGIWVMETARTAAGACVLRLVPAATRPPEQVTHDCAFVPERETAAGLVGTVGSRLDPDSGRLLDRESGVLSPLGGALLASSDRHVATWSRRLGDPIAVVDVLDGGRDEVVLPPGRTTRQAALSTDGRYLAVVLVELLGGVRSYEVWVHDLRDGSGRVATVTTLDDRPLDLTWQQDVLVVVGDGVDTYDAVSGELYRSDVQPMPSRSDVLALPRPLG